VPTTTDNVNHPKHYTSHPSGVECITVTEHMGFNLGNAVKYIWRADEKGNAIEDLEKAQWYIARELEKRKKSTTVVAELTRGFYIRRTDTGAVRDGAYTTREEAERAMSDQEWTSSVAVYEYVSGKGWTQ
jgi:hypothetical protein